MEDILARIREKLSDELKDAFAGCMTLKDAISFCEAHHVSLPEELMDSVSGGYIYSKGIDPQYHWEVINDETGDVMARLDSRRKAKDVAKGLGQSTRELSVKELERLREEGVVPPKGWWN